MEQQVSQARTVGKLTSAVAVLALGVIGTGVYSIHEYRVAKSTQERNARITASLQSTNAQVETLKAKLNEITAPQACGQDSGRKAYTSAYAQDLQRTGRSSLDELAVASGRAG